MRPHSFLSGVLIYGTVSGIGMAIVFRFMEAFSRTGASFALLDYLLLAVMFGVPMGLAIGYMQRPTIRTFDYDLSEDHGDRLERSLRALRYQLIDESTSLLTYRFRSIISVVPDVIVEKDTKPLRVGGPHYTLSRLEKKLAEGGTHLSRGRPRASAHR
jgi:hypothetical protein